MTNAPLSVGLTQAAMDASIYTRVLMAIIVQTVCVFQTAHVLIQMMV